MPIFRVTSALYDASDMGRFIVEAENAEAAEGLVREWLDGHDEIRSEDGHRIPSIQVSRTLRADAQSLDDAERSVREKRRLRIDGRPLGA